MIDLVKIAELAALEEGWDGYGAAPLTEAAVNVLKALHVSPRCDGSVQIEIFANGWETEIAFSSEGRPISYISEESTRRPVHGDLKMAGGDRSRIA